MPAESHRLPRPGHGGLAWMLAAVVLAAFVLAALTLLPGGASGGAALPPPLLQAQRSVGDDASQPVRLPDTVEAASRTALVRARYRVEIDLGTAPRPQALYASGLIGRARVHLNGALLVDEIDEPLSPTPRGLALLRLLDLPGALLRPGLNVVEIELAGRGGVSLSALRFGAREMLTPLRDRKALGLVMGPLAVAAIVGALGLAVLTLYLRLRSEAMYGYFGLGATLWALHTAWTVAPQRVLGGVHYSVWWHALYAVFVVLLVLFCLRFGQRSRRWIERTLLLGCAAVPPLLYAASALGWLGPVAEVLRLGLVVLAATALVAVAHQAWHRRRLDSALLVLTGLAGAGFGLRDWLVFRGSDDNLPVALTPYSGLPFVVLVGTLLIERFVRNAQALRAFNRDLDARVAMREAELAAHQDRLVAHERAQAAADERQRLMRELHDGLGARLVAAQLRVDRGELDREGLSRELRAYLADMRLATEALVPGETELGALVGNFLFRWENMLRDAGVHAQWQLDLPPSGLQVTPYVALQLLRVMQEALSNVLRHAEARRVRLQLTAAAGTLKLSVEDDGRGMPQGGAGEGRGIADMRSRAANIGAEFRLSAPPGGGTRIELQLALPG